MSICKVAVVTAVGLLVGSQADAQTPRCDCTSVVDTCTADVAVRGSFIEVKTDQQQCARVDYFVDGMPFVSVVVDGEDRQNWIARTTSPKVMVQSCQVCRESSGPAPARAPAASASAAEAPAGTTLQPLIAGVPEYPAAARARGVEGYVEVEFTVNADGLVEGPHVVSSQPRNTFDAAALAAVSRWRYPAAAERAPLTLKERVAFTHDDLVFGAPTSTAQPAGPRNQCLREDVVYNYGETVDVGLINACTDPLVVFGCALGTGRYADRWVCNDSEQQGTMLVGQTDRRRGNHVALDTGAGTRTYLYTDSFVVTRAPNTQYWWVACSERDQSCRADARHWTRSVGGQPASVDPEDRSPIAVARSN